MSIINHDCEAEEVLHRDPVGTEQIVREAMRSSIEQIEEEFPDSPFAQETYSKLHEALLRCPMPKDRQVHKADIIDYANRNCRVRTLDSNLLVQRYFFDNEGLGELSKEIKKPHKEPPIYSTIKCHFKREVRRERSQQTINLVQQPQRFWGSPAGVSMSSQPR